MKRRETLIAAVAAVVVGLLVLVALVLPRMGQVNEKQDELASAQEQQQTLEAQVGQLEDAKRQAKSVQKELDGLQTKIPPTVNLPRLIRQLQGSADDAAVDFMSVSPGAPAPAASGGGVSTIPMQINVTGSYFSVEEFLYKLENLPRAARVTQITVAPGGDTSGSASAASSSTTTTTTTGTTGATGWDGTLQLTLAAEVYTTDASAGPGSLPGATDPAAAAAAAGTSATTTTTTTTG